MRMPNGGRGRPDRRHWRRALVVAAAGALVVQNLPIAIGVASATVIEPGFQVATLFSGLNTPTAVTIAPDGRFFVAERDGIIKEYDNASDSTPTQVADLRTQVHAVGDRGLLGLVVDPQFPTRPYLYVLYIVDAQPGGTAPFYNDTCPLSPSGAKDGCPAFGRLSRLTIAANNQMTGPEFELIAGNYWCTQQQGHAVDHLAFGPDGALYASSGEGAAGSFQDWGQHSGAADAVVIPNACGDPPVPAGSQLSLPTTEGGALRAQDLRTSADPASGSGAIIRVNPDTGAALPDNPLVGNGIPTDDRHLAYGNRNPFRFTFRPGTNELWVADVGWNSWEEVDRIPNPTDAVVENFGWPCYEGAGRSTSWDNLNVTICENLYATGPATVTPPYWSYRHGQQPGPASCTNAGSAISAIAFAGAPYPAQYHGALFVGDYVSSCMWALMPGSNGLPDPANIKTILTGVAPVDLEAGPDGRLYYVDIGAGTVSRLDYFSSNQPPIASFTATPPYGLTPLTVQFDASATTDDGPSSSLTFQWDLDGDGQYDDATGVKTSRTYSASANVTVRLLATDGNGATGTASQVIQPGNRPPTATILSPSSSLKWAAGDTIAFNGTATDPDQTLGASAMRWDVILHHCALANPSDCHEHPQAQWNGISSGTYAAADHEYPSWLEFRLTVTDSRGLTNVASVRLDPKTVDLTFLSNPSGLQLTLTDTTATTPATYTAIVGSRVSVTANSPQQLGSTWYNFSSWSDGGAVSHDIITPSSPATYTANYVVGTSPVALFVVANPASLNAADSAVRARLQTLGYTVTTVSDAGSTPADATGKRLIVISSSSLSGNVNTKFRTANVPVITWEPGLWDDFGMTAGAGYLSSAQTSVVITNPAHPLAAGLTGTVPVATTAGGLSQGSPNGNAAFVATIPGGSLAVDFGYDTGAAMPGLSAPARRIGLFMGDATAATFTSQGWALFTAAVNWAVGGGGG
jgi:glucose/arabinose dehydrogenase/PKD repeat protein